MRVWMVLPAYNEASNVPAILDKCRLLVADTYNLDLRILLVDDGSKDDTVQVARDWAGRLPLEVLENGANRGLAETFKRGVIAAARAARPEDVIVCMDADNSHLPGQLQRMLGDIGEGRDVVIASRYRRGAVIRGVSLPRRVMSRGMSLLFRAVYPIAGVRDYSCGFRAYRAAVVQQALADQGERLFAREGFACMVGILLRLHKQGAVFGEVPIILRYDQKVGASKMAVGATVLRTLRVLLRERLDLGERHRPRKWRRPGGRQAAPVAVPPIAGTGRLGAGHAL